MTKEIFQHIVEWLPFVAIVVCLLCLFAYWMRELFLSQAMSITHLELRLKLTSGAYSVRVMSVEEAQLFLNSMNACTVIDAYVQDGTVTVADMDNNLVLRKVFNDIV